MHSERCTSGSARGHGKLRAATFAWRPCPTQPYIPTWTGFLFLAVPILCRKWPKLPKLKDNFWIYSAVDLQRCNDERELPQEAKSARE